MKKLLHIILSILIIIFIILLYSRFIGTIGLKTSEIVVQTNIEPSYNGLKIIHFSDLHYKKIITEKRVKEVIKSINQTKPDIVIFTGDLLDKDYQITNSDINFLIKQLSKIDAKYGSYAILGDHDQAQEETINNIYIQSNFTLLKNSSTIIQNENNDKIWIGGLNSSLANQADISKTIENINEKENISYKIFLIHEPDYIDNILKEDPDTSLILAGHSINGSINLPMIKKLLLPTGAKKYYSPHTTIQSTEIFISNGIGVNNINFRLFNTPSLNLYRIKKSS